MKIIEEEDYVIFAQYSELSYKDTDEKDVELFINGESEGKIKVWIDSEKKDMGIPEKECEYICLNYEIVYLDNITKR